MTNRAIALLAVLGLAAMTTAPLVAAPLSGGGSGGGAIEGGSGAPGSGVGIPGAIVSGTTAEGIGVDSTFNPTPSMSRYVALAPMDQEAPRWPTRHAHRRGTTTAFVRTGLR